MYSLLALLAGAVVKLYDDLEDNNLLHKFRNNILMEFLKGLQYVSFTSLSIKEPVFFIIQYVANIVNLIGNKEAWSKPYEHSLFYSYLLFFIIIDYKKITSFCIIDKLLCIIFIVVLFFEPILMKFLYVNKDREYSFTKLIFRCINTVSAIILYFFSKSNTTKFLTAYSIGYMFISVLVQYYSL